MDKKQLQKNLCDLEYNKILNQFNIVMILVGTLVISILISELSLNYKILAVFFSLIIILYLKHVFDKQLEEIKVKIENI